MASVNKVILIGNLGADPDCRQNGDSVIANLSIATTRKYRKGDEVVTETEWHRVSFFGRLGEIARDFLHKGSPCYVEGRLRTRKYEKDGIERYATEIIGESLQLLGGKPDGAGQAEKPQPKPQAQAQAQAQQKMDMSEDVPF